MSDNSINNQPPHIDKIAGFLGLNKANNQDSFIDNGQNIKQFNQLDTKKQKGRGIDTRQLADKELTRLKSTLTSNVRRAKSLDDIKNSLHKKNNYTHSSKRTSYGSTFTGS